MNWLLTFIPIAVALEHLAPERHLWIFVASGPPERASGAQSMCAMTRSSPICRATAMRCFFCGLRKRSKTFWKKLS
jgi:hypothetical protein